MLWGSVAVAGQIKLMAVMWEVEGAKRSVFGDTCMPTQLQSFLCVLAPFLLLTGASAVIWGLCSRNSGSPDELHDSQSD